MTDNKHLSPAALRKLQQERDDFWVALHTISQYMTPAQLFRRSEKEYGLPPDEATEYAYENVLALAKLAIKGAKKPRSQGADHD